MFLSSLFADSFPASLFTEGHPGPIMDLGSNSPFYGPRLCVLSPNHSGLPSIECQWPTDAPSMPSDFIIHILPWSHAYCYCYPTLIISHVFLLGHDALKYFWSILSIILMTKSLFRVFLVWLTARKEVAGGILQRKQFTKLGDSLDKENRCQRVLSWRY